MKPVPSLSRRDFIRVAALTGGGMIVGYALSGSALAQTTASAATTQTFAPNPFITITPDGVVTLVAKNPELGQGVKTALPMILAEELGAEFSKVKIEYGLLNSQFGPQEAGGSMAIFDNYLPLRKAGATARTLLIRAAAETWRVAPNECRAAGSTVMHGATGRALTFGELATKAAALPLPEENTIVLQRREENQLLGRRVGGVDNPLIVTGQPLFGIDQAVPGMVHAVYVKCPVFGGKVISANLDQIKQLTGVLDAFILTGTPDYYALLPGVAIIADSTWTSFKARRELAVVWDEGPGAAQNSTAYANEAAQLGAAAGTVMQNDGDVTAALATAAATAEGAYHYPFLHHAPLEPMNAIAIPLADGGMKIIAPTQLPEDARAVAAKILQLPKEKIQVRFTRMGGAFGRRLTNDFVAEAAALAHHVGRPVKLTWTREDDTQHGQYRPAGWHFLKGGVNAAGRIVAWQNHFVTVGLNNTATPGTAADMNSREFPCRFLPNYRLEKSVLSTNIPTSWMRAPGSNGLAFICQCFIDELAHAAGKDPLDFRLTMLGEDRVLPGTGRWDPAYDTARMKEVLRLVAEKAGWGKKLPRGSGQGIAFHFSHQGYVAEVAEISVARDGTLSVQSVVAAVDVGPIINLSGAESQVQGSIIDGLATTWSQEITITDGRVAQSNFHDYPLLRLNAAPPRIEVHFIASDHPPTGLGEPALPPLPPAVCNAIFAATGKRIRRLPLTQTDLQWN